MSLTTYMLGAHKGQKRVAYTMKQDLQAVDSNHVGPRNKIPGLLKEQPDLLTTEPSL